MALEINVNDEKKMVDIWLTNAEKSDPVIQAKLDQIYAYYKTKKYLVASFLSGSQPLQQNILDLLKYNKRKIAELDVERSKVANRIAANGKLM